MSQLIGKHIKQYHIEALLGEGGMGAVYRAHDTNLNRPVALKVMHPHFARQAEFQKRFHVEAQAIAQLDHPSVISVHDFDAVGGLYFIVMAFVQGVNLAAHIRQMQAKKQVVQLRETLFVMAQVADALGYAHQRGVVHRDVKPDNVLLKELSTPERAGELPLRALVTDFGLARLETAGAQTQTGMFMGTLPYMSPEQCLGEKTLDGRSDIYALGVMLYQLTTGRLPFRITSPTDAVMMHLKEKIPPPRTVNPGLPPAVDAVIMKATAKKPDQRYQSAAEMAIDLRDGMTNMTEAVVTQFAAPETMHSLMTRLESPSHIPEPSRWGYSQLQSANQLMIARQGKPPQPYVLDKDSFTIGRSSGNDIVLKEAGVSSRHAQLDQTEDGWQITDLQSTNGTFLDGVRLTARVPAPWPAHQVIRIGKFFLRRQAVGSQIGHATAVAGGAASYAATGAGTIPVGGTQLQSRSGLLNVVVTPTAVELAPGSRAELQVDILNMSQLVDHFSLSVDDLPPSWVTIPEDNVQLMPSGQASLKVVLHPPKDKTALAQTYPFQVQVLPEANPGDVTAVAAQLIIQPYEQFAVTMHPSQINSGGTTQVTIQNQGNAPASFRVVGRDPANALKFANEGGRLSVRPGEAKDVSVNVAARERPFIGQPKQLPFEMLVASARGAQRTQAGQLQVQPVLPIWLASLLSVLLLLLCGGGVLALNAFIGGDEATPTTQIAEVVGTSDTQTPPQVGGTETAVFSTSVAATEAAVIAEQQGDADGDGLSDSQEAELGTNPNNPDTDSDGLSDGQEVNEQTTNPIQKDSDADGLTDGDEVLVHLTLPLVADTDSDGVPDGTEILQETDPLAAPQVEEPTLVVETAVSTPTPTPTIPPTSDEAATLAASANEATATDQAIQAINATSTAQAAATATSLSTTATAQAIDATSTAQAAATATSLSATATAQAIDATSTAQAAATATALAALTRVAYIYKTDLTTANSYKTLLEANGYLVDLISQSDVLATDFGTYKGILIGPETGNALSSWGTNPWGDISGSQANRISGSGRPVIGLGYGGSLFFEAIGLYIDFGQSWISSAGDTGVYVVNSSHPLWTSPNSISIPANRIVALYSNNSPFVAVYYPSPVNGVTPIGRQSGDLDHYQIISEGGNDFLWGFNSSPSNMTTAGKQVFINALKVFIP